MSEHNFQSLPAGWKHAALHARVVAAVQTIDKQFKPQTRLEGISMVDLREITLQGTIEEQIAATLNATRSTWDPANEYSAYSFIRHPGRFPGVRLCTELGSDNIIMGIELSGWYVLAKECSARFKRTADVCADQDLVVVLPWGLSEVTHGMMVAFPPFVASAKMVASARNEAWKRGRKDADAKIDFPAGPEIKPYPKKPDGLDDRPVPTDSNFGRIARTGLMKDYIPRTMGFSLRDRTLEAWLHHFEMARAERGELTPPPGQVA